MQARTFAFTALTVILICLLPICSLGQDSPNYFALKGGVYSPTGDLDDSNYDSGFAGELAYGRYFNVNFAMEFSVGYFKSDASVSGSNATLGTFSEQDEIKVIPVVVSAKGVYPTGNFELFGEFGVGAFFADFEGTLITSALGTTVIDDSDTVFGVILGVGATYNITSNVFFGIEVKYLATGDVEIKGAVMGVPITLGGDLNGITATANLGFRF